MFGGLFGGNKKEKKKEEEFKFELDEEKKAKKSSKKDKGVPEPIKEPTGIGNKFKTEKTQRKIEKPSAYVKVENFKEVMQTISKIQNNIKDMTSTLGELEDLKENELEGMEKFKKSLEEAKEKIGFFQEIFEKSE